MAIIDAIHRVLTQKGTTAYSLVKISLGAFIDASKPSRGKVKTETTYSLLSYPGYYNKKDVGGSLIQAGDIKLYVDSTSLLVSITQGDEISKSSERWKIINVKPYYVNDDVVLYELQIRK